MRVGGKLVRTAQLQRARLKALALERLALDRRDLAGEEARFLGSNRAREAARGIGVDLGPGDLVTPGKILRRISHGDVGRRIAKRLPKKILEIDGAHAEAAAHRIGRDRVAAHGLRADAQREPDLLVRDDVCGLHQHFDAGAADPLHHMRRHLDRHSGIEPDMPRQAVGIEARLRH